jgi:hypothetical protein
VKKRSFILLEILIALSLITLCSVLFILSPTKLYKKQTEILWEMERERLADWTFSEIKELLLQNKIPWKRLPEHKAPPVKFPLPSFTLSIPGAQPRAISREFTLCCKREKPKGDEEIYRLLEVVIYLNKNKEYKYRVTVRGIYLS